MAVGFVVVLVRPWRCRAVPRRWSVRRAKAGRAVDAASARWFGVVVVTTAVAVAGGPVLGLLATGGGVGAVVVGERLQRRRRAAEVAAAVPDLVDLFVVSASAGQPVAGSLAAVAARAPTAIRPAVVAASVRFRRGLPLAECLSQLGADLGPAGVPLIDALRQATVSGVPLVPLLEGVAAASRDARRRRAQEVARRLPVTMLFPLVACVLPAAVVLAVVPVLLVSLGSLRL
jgi:Flp pilus assembly protein TadB